METLKGSAPWRDYGFAALIVGVATAVCFAAFRFFGLANLVMVYLLAVLAVATRGRRGPAGLASALSVLAFDFCFVPPRFTFTVVNAQYILTFVVMFATAMIISNLTVRLRAEAAAARAGQNRTLMMHAFTQQLARSRGLEKVLQTAVKHVAETFRGTVTAFIPDERNQVWAKTQSDVHLLSVEKERGVAQWAYDRRQPAGLGTGSLPDEDALYVPLQGAGESIGVLRVQPRDKAWLLASEQRLLLDSFAHQIALALEIDRLNEAADKASLEIESERLRSALLSSVSHDFRTPLAAILGSAGALLEKEDFRKNPAVKELLGNIEDEAERLSHLVQNLLEATRLESGAVRIQKEAYPLEEIVGSALDHLKKTLDGRKVNVLIPDDLPLVPVDAALLEQVFINLFENAVRHTPPESPISLSAKKEDDDVVISVSDHGPGLKADELERVFDKFYHDPKSPGAGLGLAICRAVIGAHGGRIWAENRDGGGALFQFTLPLEAARD